MIVSFANVRSTDWALNCWYYATASERDKLSILSHSFPAA
jgi:hypothetical protein